MLDIYALTALPICNISYLVFTRHYAFNLS